MKNIKTYSQFAQINESTILKFDTFKNTAENQDLQVNIEEIQDSDNVVVVEDLS